MYTILIIGIVLLALLMIGIVLIQESKGGGLSSVFDCKKPFASVLQTTTFFERVTWILAVLLFIISILIACIVS